MRGVVPLTALCRSEAVLTLVTEPPSPPVVVLIPSPATEAQPITPVVTVVQLPFEQVPLAQLVPQLPQLAGSVWVSTQALLQKDWPLGQAQLPFEQDWPLAQALPQLPQLALSVWVSMQVPLQSVCPLPHWQEPPWQVCPVLQALAQVPQLAGSV